MLISNSSGYPLMDMLLTLGSIFSVPVAVLTFKAWPWLKHQYFLRTFKDIFVVIEDRLCNDSRPIDLYKTAIGNFRDTCEYTIPEVTTVVIDGKMHTIADREPSVRYGKNGFVSVIQIGEIKMLHNSYVCYVEFAIDNGHFTLVNIGCQKPIDKYNVVYTLKRRKGK